MICVFTITAGLGVKIRWVCSQRGGNIMSEKLIQKRIGVMNEQNNQFILHLICIINGSSSTPGFNFIKKKKNAALEFLNFHKKSPVQTILRKQYYRVSKSTHIVSLYIPAMKTEMNIRKNI